MKLITEGEKLLEIVQRRSKTPTEQIGDMKNGGKGWGWERRGEMGETGREDEIWRVVKRVGSPSNWESGF